MKLFICVSILTIIWIELFSQNTNQSIETFNFSAKPDSIISEREDGYIYITTDTTSKLYNWIIPNPSKINAKDIYSNYINHIKENYKQNILINDIKEYPQQWNSIFVYKNKYFLYGPSDWMINTGYYISDSVIYITNSDPGDLYFILDFKQKNIEFTEIQIINYFGEQNKIQISLIDSNYGLYIWTFLNQKEQVKTQYLMQDSRYSKKLPMIVCDCGDVKCLMEFDFDDPNFEKLSKKKM